MTWNGTIRFFYFFFKRIGMIVIAMIEALMKPESYIKGDDFESCVRKYIYPESEYDLIVKTHDYNENRKDFVEASTYPDFLFRRRSDKEEFWVEAKYRENLYKSKVHWCEKYQLDRYREFQKVEEKTVIVAIGFGGRAKNPKRIFLVPLVDIQYTGIYPSKIKQYEYLGKRWELLRIMKNKLYDYKK